MTRGSLAALWTEMQIFVIVQVAGFKMKEWQREQRIEKRGGGRDGETPPLHAVNKPLLHMDAACVHPFLKVHTGSSDPLWIYIPLINLLHRGNNRPVPEHVTTFQLGKNTSPSCGQRKHWHYVHCSRVVMAKVCNLLLFLLSVEELDLCSHKYSFHHNFKQF